MYFAKTACDPASDATVNAPGVASHFFHVPAVVARREKEAMATRDRRMDFVREERARRQQEEERREKAEATAR